MLIPFALLAAGQWRAMIAAGATVMALGAMAYLLFGPDCWWAFAASTETSRKLLLEQGDAGFEKLQSVVCRGPDVGWRNIARLSGAGRGIGRGRSPAWRGSGAHRPTAI